MIAPHPHVPTNDGTHRITVQWTSPSDVSEFENNIGRLNEALFTLMTTLFQDTDGVFYRWESEELVETKAASSITPETAREFASPKVTFIGSRSMSFRTPIRILVRTKQVAARQAYQNNHEGATSRRKDLQLEKLKRRLSYGRLHTPESPRYNPPTLLHPNAQEQIARSHSIFRHHLL
jgi:hypothetical protein